MITYDLARGGAERVFSTLLHQFSPEKFEIVSCFWRPLFQYPYPQEIPIRILHKTRPWHIFRTMRRMTKLVDEIKPDVVFSMPVYVSMAAGEALRRAQHKSAWVASLHSSLLRNPKFPLRSWARRILPHADKILGCSRGVTESAVQVLGLDQNKMQTIYNPHNFERIDDLARESLPVERPKDKFIILHVGGFREPKNQKLLLRAFARLQKPDSQLWILGRGKLESDLKRLADRLNIQSQIHWLGFQENPFPFYRAADCFALSSRWEGLPNVLIESFACHTPVISTRCPYGPDEIIQDGVSGFLVPLDDEIALAQALHKMADDPDLRKQMADAGNNFVRQTFHQKHICDLYEDLFQNIAQKS